jgi:hypothetical protein
LIQTYHPFHYALRHACAQDYVGFYDGELRSEPFVSAVCGAWEPVGPWTRSWSCSFR